MAAILKNGLTACFILCALLATAQRTYKPHSVLSSGAWYKIAVGERGVYRLDASFLQRLGLPAAIPSGQLRLYGRREAVLPEANNLSRTDDLEELALQVWDGSDGLLSGGDYVLFFSEGPDRWHADSLQKRFTHVKNLYSERIYYYITLKEGGKRVETQPVAPAPVQTVTIFDEHLFHELDTVNFLSSGKEWYGEEFANTPGRTLEWTFADVAPDAAPNTPLTVITTVAARSIGSNSRFEVRLNSEGVQQITVPAVSSGQNSPFAAEVREESTTTTPASNLTLNVKYSGGSFNAQGWLNAYELFYKRSLTLPQSGLLAFRHWASAGATAVGFQVANADAATQVWDVTDAFQPVAMQGVFTSNAFTFSNDATRLREYMGFWKTLEPEAVGPVAPQDLHNTTEADYLIITHPQFFAQAQRLALFHQNRNKLRTTLVTTEQVFNEFSAGIPDPAALRDFVKMYYDRYRATWHQSGKYLLLFGKGSFDPKDRVNNNTNLVPCYESAGSLDPLNTYTSDDFFGFLDDAEDINSLAGTNNLDIGIGRVPAKNGEEAKAFVDKVEAYHSPAAFGPWRNNLTFVADDEDNNLHLQDAETLTATVKTTATQFNIQKVYLDAYRQEGGSAGSRYPQAEESSNNALFTGTLIWNYSGHGSPFRLAQEAILNQSIVNNLNNQTRLPLFITATCDFAPYDNPVIESLGENLLVRARTGAIALTTTSRPVFAYSNRILNNNYLQTALKKQDNGKYRTLGEALRVTKNITYQSGADVVNNRKFSLLGDPAMTLAFPTLQVVPTTINGMDISKSLDTLSATELVLVSGEVQEGGTVLTGFNGTVYLSLFDKPQTSTTLGNDPGSAPVPFQTQNALLFRGKATATAGRFQFGFRLPRDINYAFGRGKLSLYAQDGSRDGTGLSDSIVIGGISNSGITDNEGPAIKAYLNNEDFVNGSMAGPAPVLIVKLADSSGINIGGSGIDHDIVATLDGDNRTYYVLNNFYESELDDSRRGTVRFQLPELTPGPHTLTIKAWDVLNNSSEHDLTFTIVPSAKLQIDRVLNYPNPFTTRTAFWFEHNQPGTELKVTVEIYTVTGKRIKTITQAINTPGNRSSEVTWDGRDEWGARIGRGVYLYRLQVRTAGGQKQEKWERLVFLN